MEQIIKHFTPAMAAFACGVLLIGIFVVILAVDGPVAHQMTTFISDLITRLTSVSLP